MENEIRYYLTIIKSSMVDVEVPDGADPIEPFKPTYLITATRRADGPIELSICATDIYNKICDILDSYDEDMHLKADTAVEMVQLMVV